MLNSSVLLTIAPLLHGGTFSLSLCAASAPVTKAVNSRVPVEYGYETCKKFTLR